MPSLKELHQLYHRLEKNEKKYLNLHIQYNAGKAKEDYLIQINNLKSVSTFDEKKLKNKMLKLKSKRVSELNTNLFNFICNSLLLFTSNENNNIKILKDIQIAEVLRLKGLNKVAEKKLDKTIKNYQNYDSSELMCFAKKIQFKTQMSSRTSFSILIETLENKIQDGKNGNIESQYQILNLEMNKLLSKNFFPRSAKDAKDYENLLNNNLLKNNSKASTKYAMHFYYMIKAPLLTILNEFDKANELCIEAIDFVKNNFDLKKDPYPLYHQLLRYFHVQLSNKDSNNIINTLNEIEKLVHSNIKSKIPELWMIALDAYLNKSIIDKNYSEGINYFEKNTKNYLDENFLNIKRLDARAFLLARVYFLNKNYDKAIHYAQMALNGEEYKYKNSYITCKFLILMAYYNLGNMKLVHYTSKSLYMSLYKEEYLHKPEKAVLSFLKSIENTLDINKNLQKLRKTLTIESEKDYNEVFFSNGDYFEWLKIEGKG